MHIFIKRTHMYILHGGKQIMVSHEKRRLQRMQTILNSVEKCGSDGANMGKVLSVCMCEFGCSRRTALEYVQVLHAAEKIVNREGTLFLA